MFFYQNDSLSFVVATQYTHLYSKHTHTPRLLIAKTTASKTGIKCHIAVGYSVFALMPSKRCK